MIMLKFSNMTGSSNTAVTKASKVNEEMKILTPPPCRSKTSTNSYHVSKHRLIIPAVVSVDLCSATVTGFTESNSNVNGRSQATAKAEPLRSRTV